MGLKLLHKGLILVCIPLCFEISIFGILISLENQAESEAQRINRSKQINDAVNHIMIYGIRVGQIRHNYSSDYLSSARFRNDVSNLLASFKQAEQLTADDPVLSKKVEAGHQSLYDAFYHIDDIKQSLKTANPLELPGLVQQNREDLDHDMDEARTTGLLDLAETSLKATDDARSRVLRERTTLLLKYAVALSVLTAIFGAAIFGKHLANRIQKLRRNANKLAKGEPLEPADTGTDELAELDRSFHYAANLISRATRIRQGVTAVTTRELKAPLHTIRDFIGMARRGELGEIIAPDTPLLSLSEKETRRMEGLIDSVLQLEKMRNGTLELQVSEVDLIALVDRSLDSVAILADAKQIEFQKDFIRAHQILIKGDAFWLEQVLVNILSNAIKFSPRQTFIKVTAETSSSHVVIGITDNGPGIPKDQQRLIFERFHRVESTKNVSGSGLGLTISRELMELHKGSIEIKSEVGAGSTFYLRFNRARNAIA